ncbi:MAG: CPBP family intramembrane metalloprotease [Gemmatimonadota bacterium]|nr:MAG: CPBP family intramembrane metalloprotease [Gemmatimonadota bacterium]
MTPREYFSAPREPRYSLLFALPLLLLYEGLSALLSRSALGGVRNGAGVLLKSLFVGLGGHAGLAVFGVVLLGVGSWIVWRDQRARGGRLDPQVFLGMLGESIVYAAVFGQVVAVLTTTLLRGVPLAAVIQEPLGSLPLGTQLVVSLGAGIYEELLFRVLLVSGLLWLFMRMRWRRRAAVAVALVVSALIFSVFHYVGPYGDPLTAPSFTFRAIAGLLLSGLYVARGFGIAAWTHALYDVGFALFAR